VSAMAGFGAPASAHTMVPDDRRHFVVPLLGASFKYEEKKAEISPQRHQDTKKNKEVSRGAAELRRKEGQEPCPQMPRVCTCEDVSAFISRSQAPAWERLPGGSASLVARASVPGREHGGQGRPPH